MAGYGTQGGWLRPRLMAIDGFVLDIPDTEDNDTEFGRPGSSAGAGAYPQLRVVGLGECGSHAIVDAEIGAAQAGEQALAECLLRSCEPNMLVMADRNFFGFPLWRTAVETGADLLWRVRSPIRLPVVTPLPDGSYRSLVCRPGLRDYHRAALIAALRAGESVQPAQALVVRVIEYEVPDRDSHGKDEIIRLITTMLDPA
jgi:hypothetical protein